VESVRQLAIGEAVLKAVCQPTALLESYLFSNPDFPDISIDVARFPDIVPVIVYDYK